MPAPGVKSAWTERDDTIARDYRPIELLGEGQDVVYGLV